MIIHIPLRRSRTTGRLSAVMQPLASISPGVELCLSTFSRVTAHIYLISTQPMLGLFVNTVDMLDTGHFVSRSLTLTIWKISVDPPLLIACSLTTKLSDLEILRLQSSLQMIAYNSPSSYTILYSDFITDYLPLHSTSF